MPGNGNYFCFSVKTNTVLPMYIAGYVTDVAVDADGRYFVTAESDQRVLMWNLKVRKFQKQIFLFSFLQ